MHSPSSGHESGSGGGHVCNKCGWPFPNPHPSARHRRSHRKVCGTLEGYKLLDRSMSLSDEDRLSDDDQKSPSPSPKPGEKTGCMEFGGRGDNDGRSSRSEDELFSDAVTEFNEAGPTVGSGEHLEEAKLAENSDGKGPSRNLTMFYSFKDNALADIIEPLNSSTDSSTSPYPEGLKISTNSPANNPEESVPVLSSTEESAYVSSSGKDKLACVTSSEVQETKMINASGDFAKDFLVNDEQETDAKEDSKSALDRVNDNVLTKDHGVPPAVTESKIQGETTSHLSSAGGVVLSKESVGDATAAAKMSSGPIISGFESSEHMNVISTVPMNANSNAEQDPGFAGSDNLTKGQSGKEEANDNVLELVVPADIPVVHHAETNTVVDTQPSKIIENKKDNAEHPVSVDNIASVQSVQFSEVPNSSATHISEYNLLHEGSKHVVEEQSTEGKTDEHEVKLTSNDKSADLGMPVAPVTIEKESFTVGSAGNQATFVGEDSLPVGSPDTALDTSKDVPPMTSRENAIVVDLNEDGNHKNNAIGLNETNAKLGNDEDGKAEVNNAKNRTSAESPTDLPGATVNPATKVHESDDTDDHEKSKIQNSAVMVAGTEKEPVKEKLPSSEYATSVHKVGVADDILDITVMDMTAVKLPETKVGIVDKVSYTEDSQTELESSVDDKAQEKQVAVQDQGVELLYSRTSGDDATKVPAVSSITESPLQNSAVIDVNGTGESRKGDSDTHLSLQAENQHQLGASMVDASVDTLSQTDSVEANWGSISVLSTQSDTPVIDSETQAKGAAERQHSSKSDIFEAPSFMTLVEPGSGANHKAAAATATASPQTQTSQNMQQQNAASSQAGWFPSLTHVVNESEGRKKNEEIIAKVTNWSTGKTHTPLKNLLGEAKNDMKPKSPNRKENLPSPSRNNETVSKDDRAEAAAAAAAKTTVSSILGPENTKREMGKDSPARYHANIKTDNRKAKGRPVWAQFICCSSVN